MKRVLVLRPEPGASETVQRAKAKGLDAEASPLFVVEPIEWEFEEPSAPAKPEIEADEAPAGLAH